MAHRNLAKLVAFREDISGYCKSKFQTYEGRNFRNTLGERLTNKIVYKLGFYMYVNLKLAYLFIGMSDWGGSKAVGKRKNMVICWKIHNNHFRSLLSIYWGLNLRFMVGSEVDLMEITYFSGDKDKNEINPREWLRMIIEFCKTPFGASNHFYGETWDMEEYW